MTRARPGTVIVEEVPAFKRYLETFCQKLVALGYGVRAFGLDAKDWIDWARPRTALP